MKDPHMVDTESSKGGAMEGSDGPQKRLERNGYMNGNSHTFVNGIHNTGVVNGVSDMAENHNEPHEFEHTLHFPERHVQHSRNPSPQSPRHVPEGAPSPFRNRPDLLIRSHSDFGPRNRKANVGSMAAEEDKLAQIRHGWDDEYTSNEYLSLLQSVSHWYVLP